jgi:hypothetical protein
MVSEREVAKVGKRNFYIIVFVLNCFLRIGPLLPGFLSYIFFLKDFTYIYWGCVL